MKKQTLKFQPKYDFKLLGIVCTCSAIKFAREIKLISDLEIYLSENHEIYNEKSPETQQFLLYEALENDEVLSIYILANKSEMGFLIEEHKNIDFFIIIKGEEKNQLTQQIKKELRNQAEIMAVFDINPENLNSKQKLLL
ncbi:MAG: IPExxxVDY family protein [Bacteroidales bacterium]|nr:IPExxxVDY family protein [Bacteroidales bacterium]